MFTAKTKSITERFHNLEGTAEHQWLGEVMRTWCPSTRPCAAASDVSHPINTSSWLSGRARARVSSSPFANRIVNDPSMMSSCQMLASEPKKMSPKSEVHSGCFPRRKHDIRLQPTPSAVGGGFYNLDGAFGPRLRRPAR